MMDARHVATASNLVAGNCAIQIAMAPPLIIVSRWLPLVATRHMIYRIQYPAARARRLANLSCLRDMKHRLSGCSETGTSGLLMCPINGCHAHPTGCFPHSQLRTRRFDRTRGIIIPAPAEN
jgi:hypothetical protein